MPPPQNLESLMLAPLSAHPGGHAITHADSSPNHTLSPGQISWPHQSQGQSSLLRANLTCTLSHNQIPSVLLCLKMVNII